MAKQPESKLQKKIQVALNREVGGWWFKVWGGPFMPSGIPDLIGCVDGLFFALEVKRPIKSSKPSKIQLATIRKIVMQGGGCATIVRSPEEAVNVVNFTLAQAAAGLRVRVNQRRGSAVMRAKNRQDLHHYRPPREADEVRRVKRR